MGKMFDPNVSASRTHVSADTIARLSGKSFAVILMAYDEARADALVDPSDDEAQQCWSEATDAVIAANPETVHDVAAKLDVMVTEGRISGLLALGLLGDLPAREAAHA